MKRYIWLLMCFLLYFSQAEGKDTLTTRLTWERTIENRLKCSDTAYSKISSWSKKYVKANHLGNVNVVLADRKLGLNNRSVLEAFSYYPGGMIADRMQSGVPYRFTYNGKELDTETGWQDYGMRMYNPNLSRFFSVDPITDEYPELTPYQFASNRPIDGIDRDGLEYTGINPSNAGEYGRMFRDGGKAINEWRQQPADPALCRAWESAIGYPEGSLTSNGDIVMAHLVKAAQNQRGPYASGSPFRMSRAPKLTKVNSKQVNANTTKTATNQAQTQNATTKTKKQQTLEKNKAASKQSEGLVKEQLISEKGPDEVILEKPRIYIGDGSTGEYSNPDFAVYNTKTKTITRIVDAKDGGAGFTDRQVELNEKGGVFYGTSRNEAATKKIIGKEGIAVEAGKVEKKQTSVQSGN